MSTKELAANAALPGDPDVNSLLNPPPLAQMMAEAEAETAQESVETADHRKYPMTKEAFDLYHEKATTYLDLGTRKEQAACRRHFLPMEDVWEISQALSRQITLDDLNLLVGLDGPRQTCSRTKWLFQPVWWLNIFNRERFLDMVCRHKAIGPAKGFGAGIVGCFYLKRDSNDVTPLIVSGVPFRYRQNPRTRRIETTTSGLQDTSAIFKFHLTVRHNRWGVSSKKCSEIIAERKKPLKAQKGLEQKIIKFTPGAKLPKQNRPGGSIDRRQFRKAH